MSSSSKPTWGLLFIVDQELYGRMHTGATNRFSFFAQVAQQSGRLDWLNFHDTHRELRLGEGLFEADKEGNVRCLASNWDSSD